MRVEGIGDSSGTGLPNRAFDQARAFRQAVRPAASATATETVRSEPTAPTVVRDVHDATAQPTPVADLSVTATTVLQQAAAARQTMAPLAPPKVDTDGDGWIDLNDLPYDYFQILRQTNIKPRNESLQPATGGAVAARRAASESMFAALDAL
ncbi:MAG: hypothetical protein WD023_09010 [Ilumatobacteraceae bacterium]